MITFHGVRSEKGSLKKADSRYSQDKPKKSKISQKESKNGRTSRNN